MRALADARSRRLALRRGLTAAVALTATSPLSGGSIAAQEEKMTASGAGVNLKLRPDVEGAPTVPLRESFGFDAHYAQCIIEDNPEAFAMETFAMGKVVIEPHSFVMAMYAHEMTLVSIRDAGDGRRVAKLTGELGCLTEAGTASGRVGSRMMEEPAFFEIEAADGGHGGGGARQLCLYRLLRPGAGSAEPRDLRSQSRLHGRDDCGGNHYRPAHAAAVDLWHTRAVAPSQIPPRCPSPYFWDRSRAPSPAGQRIGL